jgi:hypothetical protein
LGTRLAVIGSSRSDLPQGPDTLRAVSNWAYRLVALLLALAGSAATSQAHAQTFQPIRRNDFNIDVFTGPTFASGRLVGMAGAYAPIATGIDGVAWNTSAYATRELWETSWFGWELSLGLVFPGAFSGDDLDNNGDSSIPYNSLIFLSGGLRFQFGDFGIGVLQRAQGFSVVVDGTVSDVSLNLTNLGIGHAFFDGQLVLGAGLRVATFDISQQTGATLVEFTGAGFETGVMLGLDGLPWRMGASVRTSVSSRITEGASVDLNSEGQRVVGSFILPNEVHLPWEVEFGFAYQFGSRPLNRRWINPHEVEAEERAALRRRQGARLSRVPLERRDEHFWQRERARRVGEEAMLQRRLNALQLTHEKEMRLLSREYVLLSADILLSGVSPNAIGLEAFLSQQRQGAGETVSPTLRIGAETEPWPNRLKLRLGSYLEPSRFDESGFRMHATFGLDVRLFDWTLFGMLDEFSVRVTASADIAPRYNDWGIAIGFWH